MTSRKSKIVPGTSATLALAMAVAAAGPAGCHFDASAQATRDSSGIRVIENARPADDSRLPWRIGPEPAVSIGEVVGEEAYLLHQANDATILPDGRSNRGQNPGRKSSNYLQGCTICVSCRCPGPCWTVPRKRENRSQSAGVPRLIVGTCSAPDRRD